MERIFYDRLFRAGLILVGIVLRSISGHGGHALCVFGSHIYIYVPYLKTDVHVPIQDLGESDIICSLSVVTAADVM